MNAMETNVDGLSDFSETCRFIEALVQAMQSYGVSSHAMVMSLSQIVQVLGVHGEFIVTPNSVQAVLWKGDRHQQRVYLSTSRSGNYNLAKLVQVSRLAKKVEGGSVRPAEGIKCLEEIDAAGDQFGSAVNAMAFLLSAASFAVMIGASWIDALIGGAVSLVSFAITLVASRSAGVAALEEFLVALTATVLAGAAATIVPGTHPNAVAVLAVIVFVPGFGLTIAPRELIMGNTLSGIIWFTNAFVAAIKIVGGAAIGVIVATRLGLSIKSVSPLGAIAPVWGWAAVPMFVLALAVLFKVDWRQFGWIVIGAWLVWGLRQSGDALGFWQGTFFGAAALMIYSSWCSIRYGLPSSVITLPCVMILVPGLAALKALQIADAEGVVAGLQAGYDVVILIFVIIGGSIVGDAVAVHKLAKTSQAVRTLIGWPAQSGEKKSATEPLPKDHDSW